ncbi:MAG: PIN domain-containing protein [Dehalococcoidia bacterium]
MIESWRASPGIWIPTPGDLHLSILGSLAARYGLRGPELMDGHIAALAMEHGLTVVSFDRGFARFEAISWLNLATQVTR